MLQKENGHSECSKHSLMCVFCLPGLCEFQYLLSCVPFFALVTAFCAHDERSDGLLFTLCDYSSEKLLFCSDDAIYQIGPTVPFSGMHTLASTSIMDIELCRVFSFLFVLRQIKAPTVAFLIPHKY